MESSAAAAQSRSGLQTYPVKQVNAAASGAAALPNKALEQLKQTSESQSSARRSGSKRTFDEASTTDNVQQKARNGDALPTRLLTKSWRWLRRLPRRRR